MGSPSSPKEAPSFAFAPSRARSSSSARNASFRETRLSRPILTRVLWKTKIGFYGVGFGADPDQGPVKTGFRARRFRGLGPIQTRVL
jgi:hypothetical protein